MLVGMAAVRVADPSITKQLRLDAFGFYNQLSPRVANDPSPVVIIDIDEKSLREIGQWPWPRTVLADLIVAARDNGMAVVGIDALLPEPDQTSLSLLADRIQHADEATRQALAAIPPNEVEMADAMRSMRTVVAQIGIWDAEPEPLSREAVQSSVQVYMMSRGSQGALVDTNGRKMRTFEFAQQFLSEAPVLVPNVPALESAAAGRGHISVGYERDGVVRRVPLIQRIQGVVKPALALEILRVAFGGKSIQVQVNAGGIEGVGLPVPGKGTFFIPTDGRGRMWVNFAVPDRPNTPDNSGRLYVSAADILNSKVPKERLEGRLALVGTSAVGLYDIKRTPLSDSVPGVEVHANLIEAILQGAFLKRPIENSIYELGALLVVGLIFVFAIPRLSPFDGLGVAAIFVGICCAFSWVQFAYAGVLFDAVYLSIAAVFLYWVLAFGTLVRIYRENKQLKAAM